MSVHGVGLGCHHSPGDMGLGGRWQAFFRQGLREPPRERAVREVTEEVPRPRSHSQPFRGWDRAIQRWAVLGTLGCRMWVWQAREQAVPKD